MKRFIFSRFEDHLQIPNNENHHSDDYYSHTQTHTHTHTQDIWGVMITGQPGIPKIEAFFVAVCCFFPQTVSCVTDPVVT